MIGNKSVPTRTKPICRNCGSDEITRDASAEWCIAFQTWTLVGTYDSTTCQACHSEGDDLANWVPITGNEPEATPSSSALLMETDR